MSQNDKNDFLATLFDGVADDIAKYFNRRIREFTPIALDWSINISRKQSLKNIPSLKQGKTRRQNAS